MLVHCCRDFHSAIRALVRSVTDVGRLVLDLDKTMYRPHFVHGGIVMLKQEQAFPILWKQRIIWNVIVCCSLKIFLPLNEGA